MLARNCCEVSSVFFFGVDVSVVHYFIIVPLNAALAFATLLGWLDSSCFGEIGCIQTLGIIVVCFA